MVSESVFGKSQIERIRQDSGERAFRPERNFNAAVHDAIMVVTTEGLAGKRLPQPNVYRKKYEKLLKDVTFINATKANTSDE